MAIKLLGCTLVSTRGPEVVSARIVEVEAYLGAEDKAAHSYQGKQTARNTSMFLEGGHIYVYLIYGMHHCLNLVTGKVGDGAAVLIRAVEPLEGIDLMRERRGHPRKVTDLCSGPGKLAQAMGIDKTLNGLRLGSEAGLTVEGPESETNFEIVATPRVGIDYAEEWAAKPLRFFIRGNPHVSKGPKG